MPCCGISLKHGSILNWGGLKGSLSIALALSLPTSFEGKDDVLVLTFSVVLFSLLVQGLTIKPLVLRLGVGSTNESSALKKAE
ncbi:cation:proton antiporter domain-containing protein [Paenibacillus sp. YAF4_2]|uniref:cation:proton antiporter domain-containing protein n=1 Tax=Paenibacillus sp. YAF4_2 TaxID=3233085 RepID=UPI003F9DE295